MKKSFTAKEKAAIALRAAVQMESASVIGSATGAHPVQIDMWKKALKDNAHLLFENTKNESHRIRVLQDKIDELHRIIGKREEEISWLEKKSALCRL